MTDAVADLGHTDPSRGDAQCGPTLADQLGSGPPLIKQDLPSARQTSRSDWAANCLITTRRVEPVARSCVAMRNHSKAIA
jgi:hypothetical protein